MHLLWKKLTRQEKKEHIIPNALSGQLVSKEICCSVCNAVMGKTVDRYFGGLFSPLLKREYQFYKSRSAKTWPGDKLSDCIKAELLQNNLALAQGLSKIAIEYAVYHGIEVDLLRHNYTVSFDESGIIERIIYNTRVIPFVPLNRFDQYLEYEAPFLLNHKLILYSLDHELICYI